MASGNNKAMHDCNTQPDLRVTDLDGDDGEVLSAFETLDAQTRELIDRSLEFLVPVEAQPPSSGPVLSGYDSFVHAKLCRMVLLGLSRSSAARACGISPSTLSVWLKRRPKLAIDMDSSAELANAHAALLLRNMMTGRDTVAFNAVKLFLTTHSPEFKERRVVEVDTVDPADVMKQIRQGLYGLSGDLPIIDAEPLSLDAASSSAAASLPASDMCADVSPGADSLDFNL